MKSEDVPCIYEALLMIARHYQGALKTATTRQDWSMDVLYSLHLTDPRLKAAVYEGDLEKSVSIFWEITRIPIGIFNRHDFRFEY